MPLVAERPAHLPGRRHQPAYTKRGEHRETNYVVGSGAAPGSAAAGESHSSPSWYLLVTFPWLMCTPIFFPPPCHVTTQSVSEGFLDGEDFSPRSRATSWSVIPSRILSKFSLVRSRPASASSSL